MPRYFFHTEDGSSQLDHEGMELDSARTAQVAAVKLMGETLKDQPEDVLGSRAFRVIVTDEAGLILFVLDLSAVEAPALSSRRA